MGDEMIELLKSGTINNRLLSELALHPEFQRFLTDVEIYVDRIADMRIRDINTVLDAVRQQVITQRNPGENDLYVRTLELAQVDEDDYFSHVLHEDLDKIIRDVRDTHRKDSLTAEDTTPAEAVKKQLEASMQYEGSADEKRVRIYLASLGIDYDALTPEEVVTQIRILKKSRHMKSQISQRGKASGKKKGKKR